MFFRLRNKPRVILLRAGLQNNTRLKPLRSAQKVADPPVAYAENFHWGVFIEWHMMVICIWIVLFVTSQFDVIFMFLYQSFDEVC